MGPLVTAAARDRVKRLVDSGVEQGAELAVDGRNFTMQGYENGFFVGGCLFDRVTSDMDIYKEEIRSEEHTSELQSLMRISYAVFCLKKNKTEKQAKTTTHEHTT